MRRYADVSLYYLRKEVLGSSTTRLYVSKLELVASAPSREILCEKSLGLGI